VGRILEGGEPIRHEPFSGNAPAWPFVAACVEVAVLNMSVQEEKRMERKLAMPARTEITGIGPVDDPVKHLIAVVLPHDDPFTGSGAVFIHFDGMFAMVE